MVEQAGELAVRQADGVESLEFLAEIGLQGVPVVDIQTVGVFEADQLLDETLLNICFADLEVMSLIGLLVAFIGICHLGG